VTRIVARLRRDPRLFIGTGLIAAVYFALELARLGS
jgi:hypothetical protein